MPTCPRCARGDKVYYWFDFLDAAGSSYPDYRADYSDGPCLIVRDIFKDLAAYLAAPGHHCKFYGRPALADVAAAVSTTSVHAESSAADYIGPRTKCCFFALTGSDIDYICDYKHLEGVKLQVCMISHV